MPGDFVSRAERALTGGHPTSGTADPGAREEECVVVASPGASAVGLCREQHAHGVVAGLELDTTSKVQPAPQQILGLDRAS